MGLRKNEEAAQHFQEALYIATINQNSRAALHALVGLAFLEVGTGVPERALELLALVLAHPACDQWTKERAISLQTRLTAELSHKLVAKAEARGRELDLWPTAESLLTELTELGWGD